MSINEQVKNPFSYGYLCFSMAITFWFISVFEILAKFYAGIKSTNSIAFFYKIINDFWTVVLISVLFLPLYLILHYSKKTWKDTPFKIIFTLIVIVQFALTKYHLTTLVNLGADFLGYSPDDMYTTVTASETFSILYFVPFIVFPI